MKRKAPTEQPARCHCNRHVDTPAWVGARRTGSGLGAHGAPAHGNPFTHKDGCVHSDLQRTTRAKHRKQAVRRVRLG